MNVAKGTKPIVAGAALMATAIIVISVPAADDSTQGWLLAARYTARWSFAMFLVAYLGPVLVRGIGDAGTRATILAFGAVHGIHLGALVTYRVVVDETPEAGALAVGGLAYALIAALMVAEIFNKSGRVSRSVALHYALVVFVLTYATRLNSSEQYWVGVIGVAVGGAAFLIRVFVALRNRGVERSRQSVP